MASHVVNPQAATVTVQTNNFRQVLKHFDNDGNLKDGVQLSIECAICKVNNLSVVSTSVDKSLDEDTHEAYTVLRQCGHAFGYECAASWFNAPSRPTQCPYCRTAFSSGREKNLPLMLYGLAPDAGSQKYEIKMLRSMFGEPISPELPPSLLDTAVDFEWPVLVPGMIALPDRKPVQWYIFYPPQDPEDNQYAETRGNANRGRNVASLPRNTGPLVVGPFHWETLSAPDTQPGTGNGRITYNEPDTFAGDVIPCDQMLDRLMGPFETTSGDRTITVLDYILRTMAMTTSTGTTVLGILEHQSVPMVPFIFALDPVETRGTSDVYLRILPGSSAQLLQRRPGRFGPSRGQNRRH
ncbi:hypothetical protein F4861DRAFT_536336 [Xylaria intraflava]|nr:hypothetical protein F4861DRAFT_536336 [Xylaria intraflava]